MAHGVAIRERELAIRQAIGASPADCIRALTLETTTLVLAGGAVALLCLPAAEHVLRSSVQGVAPLSETRGLAVAMALGLAGTCCAYLPARRAGRLALAPLLKRD